MNQNIHPAINAALVALSRLQQPDGSFTSVTLPPSGKPAERAPTTTYYASLVLLCIRDAPDTPEKDLLVQNGLEFLRHTRNEHFSWNYLSDRKASPYPDDLDDTFLALLAISTYEPESISPETVARVTRLLIENESAPAGPYYTWITPDDQRAAWTDIDPVANSNIAEFLARYDVVLTGMKSYFESKISSEDFSSLYYPSSAVMYFLAKNASLPYRRPLLEKFKASVTPPATILEAALAVTSALSLGQSKEEVSHLVEMITDKTDWQKPLPFFIEKIEGGSAHFSGCEAFTVAAVLEALVLYAKDTPPQDKPALADDRSRHQRGDLLREMTSRHPLLQEEITRRWEILEESDSRGELCLISKLLYDRLISSLRKGISPATVHSLCLAGSLGWIGYSLQDDIFDGQEESDRLPVATACILLCQNLINGILIGVCDSSPVIGILNDMNEALLDERNARRTPVVEGVLSLPDNLEPLKETGGVHKKSIGYSLGPAVLMLMLDTENTYGIMHDILDFFRRYLTARQLHDDMHDWYDDLCQGVINPAGAVVLEHYQRLHPGSRLVPLEPARYELHSLFWNSAMGTLTSVAKGHLAAARKALGRLSVFEAVDFLEQMISRYETSLDRAEKERVSAIAFIATYEKTTP